MPQATPAAEESGEEKPEGDESEESGKDEEVVPTQQAFSRRYVVDPYDGSVEAVPEKFQSLKCSGVECVLIGALLLNAVMTGAATTVATSKRLFGLTPSHAFEHRRNPEAATWPVAVTPTTNPTTWLFSSNLFVLFPRSHHPPVVVLCASASNPVCRACVLVLRVFSNLSVLPCLGVVALMTSK